MSGRCVYIYRAAKTAMQSGRALTEHWLAEFSNSDSQRTSASASLSAWQCLPDAVMKWHGGGDTSNQVRLTFPDLESALRWAESQGLTPIVRPSQVRKWECKDGNKDINKSKSKSKSKSKAKDSLKDSAKVYRKSYAKSYASNFAHDRKVPWTH